MLKYSPELPHSHHMEKRKCNTATCVTQRLADFLIRSSNTLGTVYAPTNVGANTYGKRDLLQSPIYLPLQFKCKHSGKYRQINVRCILMMEIILFVLFLLLFIIMIMFPPEYKRASAFWCKQLFAAFSVLGKPCMSISVLQHVIMMAYE